MTVETDFLRALGAEFERLLDDQAASGTPARRGGQKRRVLGLARRPIVLGAVACVFAAALALTFAVETNQDAAPGQHQRQSGSLGNSGANPTVGDRLKLLTKLGASRVVAPVPGVSSSLVSPPAGFGLPARARWLAISVAVPSAHPTAIQEVAADFKALAVAGAYNDDRANARGMTYSWRLPDGSKRFELEAPFDYKAAMAPTIRSAAAIRRSIERKVTALGYSVASISFVDADLPSPRVVISVEHPKRFFADPPTITQLIGLPDSFEAFQLTITDRAGAVIGTSTYSGRTGLSSAWRAPGYGSAGVSGQIQEIAPATGPDASSGRAR